MFGIKTFKATIHGTHVIRIDNTDPVPTIITFNKKRVLLTEKQVNVLCLDPFCGRFIIDREEYEFDKLYNKEDKKQYSIIFKQKTNSLDKGIHHLDISFWNKIRANILHHRYWIDREKEWFLKTLVSTLIGFIFGLMGAYVGYKLGIQSGTTTKIKTQQDQSQPIKR